MGGTVNKVLGVVGLGTEEPPDIEPPPVEDPEEKRRMAEAAARRRRRRAQGAQGPGSTILTGPQGVGTLGPTQKGTKTLLGT